MSSIPEDIIFTGIFQRLPVKSLLVCKSVCKNWYARISTSDFVKLHLHFSTHTRKSTLMLENSTFHNGFYSIGCDLLESPVSEIAPADFKIDFPFHSFSFLEYGVRLAGSCYGLVCIWIFEKAYDTEFVCLWNPATREYKRIPEPPIEMNGIRAEKTPIIHALNYDHKTDDYKLAVGVTTRKDIVFQIYSLTSNSWKVGPTVPYSFSYPDRWDEVLVNGHHHWLLKAQGKFFLLSLDIYDESFKEIQLPKEILEKSHEDDLIILGVLEGCLCLLDSSYVNGVKINVEVWKMLDYGVHESWTRRCIITHESFISGHILELSALWSFENGKILFMNDGVLVLYDPEHGSARNLSYCGGFGGKARNYIESLVSLKSGTYVEERSLKKKNKL